MNKGDHLPLSDHIIRYISPTHIDHRSDGVSRMSATGFTLRRHDQGKLSCNWLEYFEGSDEEQLQYIRDVSRVTLRKNGRYVMLNVGVTLSTVKERTLNQILLHAIYEPLDATDTLRADLSHAVLTNFPDEDSAIYDCVKDLLVQTIRQIFPATVS